MLSNLTLTRFIDLIRDAGKAIPKGWLFLPKNKQWTLNTQGVIISINSLYDSEVTKDDKPLFAENNNLISTLDGGTLQDIYECALRLEEPLSDDTLFEAFIFYYRFDAFLPNIGAANPPSTEVVIRNMDREFYDLLGDESKSTKCKHTTCDRGTVRLSVFCRIHHFESIQQKTCPFDD